MREIGQLGQDERRALVVGQALDVGDERAEIGPHLDLVAQALRARDLRLTVGDGAAPGQQREAAVARDREQPRPQLRGRPALAQCPVGAQEGLLQRVLGLLARPTMWRQNPSSARWWRS